jgi:UPF0755 protein
MKRLLLVLFLLALGAAAALHYLVRMDRYAGFTEPVFVDIPLGTPMLDIARRLEEAGVVRHAALFAAARLPNPAAYPQAGEYRFTAPATPHEVYLRIARGDVYLVDMVVPEGADAFDLAAIVARAGFATEEEFLPIALKNEGYLFPSTYRFPRRTTGAEAAAAMRRQFDRVWQEIAGEAPVRPEIVALASLVEKEAVLAEERRRIAGVFANRLRLGMRLQCDPTGVYAARLEGRWRGVIYRSDLDRAHPYNTYQTAGLPPGPIANPGRAALEAALRPLDTEELYFVAAPDGSGAHIFSKDYDAHERAVADYRRGLRNQQKGEGARPRGGAAGGSR